MEEPRIKAGRCRGLPGRGERRGEMEVLPRLLRLLLLLLAASSAALLATSAHSSCPGPLAHTMHSTFMFAATSAPLGGLASPRTRTRRLAHPLQRRELARLLALVFPSRSGRSGAGNRSAGDPQASGAAHWLRTLQRNAPETRLASSSPQSRGQPQALSVRAYLHSPADPPSRPFSTDPSPPQGQRPAPWQSEMLKWGAKLALAQGRQQ